MLSHLPCSTSEDTSPNNSVGEFMVIFASKFGDRINLIA